MKSIKELYRIGTGPSSSHTMGSRKAAEMFLERHPDAASFKVTLYGSLAATQIIVILRCNDKPVDGLLEFLLPARAALGFGVLLVAHAFVLRGRDNREKMCIRDRVNTLPFPKATNSFLICLKNR